MLATSGLGQELSVGGNAKATLELNMFKFSKLVAAAAATLAMGAAQAVTVAGVTWDPNSPFDFTTTDQMVETVTAGEGSTIQGYARINSLNGENQASFCASGCELTYKFSGYTLVDDSDGFTFTGGQIDVYVDSTPNFNQSLASTATDGLLFLSLSGRLHIDGETGEIGTLFSDPTPTLQGVQGDGRGFLDVIGGAAAAYFDTNTIAVVNPDGSVGFADFLFTSSFQLLRNPFVSDDGVTYALFGSNDLQGDSINIPEPGSLALVGLGLLGAGLSRRRKS
jgi:hypothetical protein